jgi:hypothetical protein
MIDADSGDGFAREKDGHIHLVRNFRVKRGDTGHTHSITKSQLIDTGVRNDTDKESIMDQKQKTAAVNELIANVCCWKEEDREVLNGMADEHLTALVANGKELVANEARHKTATDELAKTHTLNDKTGKWALTDNGKHDDKKGGTVKKATDAAPLSRDEWLAQAPPDVVENLAFAETEMQRQKEEIVGRLVENVPDNDKAAQVERLHARPLADLQADAALLPEPPKSRMDYSGAAGGPSRVTANVDATQNFSAFGLPTDYIKAEAK